MLPLTGKVAYGHRSKMLKQEHLVVVLLLIECIAAPTFFMSASSSVKWENSISLSYFTGTLRLNSFTFIQPAKVHIWKGTSEVQDKLYCKSCLIFFFAISINTFKKKKKANIFSQNVFDGVSINK